MHQRGFANIALVVLGIIFTGVVGYFGLAPKSGMSPSATQALQSEKEVNQQASPPPSATQELGKRFAGGSSSMENQTGGPRIQSLTPKSGHVGDLVTIHGSGFTPTQNVVKFGFGYTSYLNSPDGVTLKFYVPSSQDECHPSGTPCYEKKNIPVTAGEYSVTVTNPNGMSNSVTFMVE